MLRTFLLLAALTLLALPAPAQTADHPPTLTPDGGTPLPRAGQATRVFQLGAVELYSLAIYADAPLNDPVRLLPADVPKALRIEVKYKDDLRRHVSYDWRPELLPRLEPAAIAHLRGTFAPLNYGEVVLIEYVPDKGTTVRVNKSVAVSGASHDLMLSFLDHWLGQRPLSEQIKRTLMASS